MDTNTAAIWISSASLLLSGIALGWNIYKDVILKARLKVTFNISIIVTPGMDERPEYLAINVTNFGPGPVTVEMIVAKNAPFWRRILRRPQYAMIAWDYTNPLSARLPKTLQLGERMVLLLDYDENAFLRGKFTHVGVADSFNRNHWASSKSLLKAKREWQEKFGESVLSTDQPGETAA